GCGSTVSVRVGDVRANATINPFTTGRAGVGGCGTVAVTTGAVQTVFSASGSSLNASIAATSIGAGIDIRGNGITNVTNSTLNFTVGTTQGLNVIGTSNTSVRVQGNV